MSARERLIAAWVERTADEYERYRAEHHTSWPPYPASHRAADTERGAKFADALIARRNLDAEDEAVMAVELFWICADRIDDPHDWDHVSTVADLLDWYFRTAQRRG